MLKRAFPVNAVVEPKKLMDEAKEMAALIANKPVLAVRAAKEAINHGLNMTLHEGLEVEAFHWSYPCGTEDQKEGATAPLLKNANRNLSADRNGTVTDISRKPQPIVEFMFTTCKNDDFKNV